MKSYTAIIFAYCLPLFVWLLGVDTAPDPPGHQLTPRRQSWCTLWFHCPHQLISFHPCPIYSTRYESLLKDSPKGIQYLVFENGTGDDATPPLASMTLHLKSMWKLFLIRMIVWKWPKLPERKPLNELATRINSNLAVVWIINDSNCLDFRKKKSLLFSASSLTQKAEILLSCFTRVLTGSLGIRLFLLILDQHSNEILSSVSSHTTRSPQINRPQVVHTHTDGCVQ